MKALIALCVAGVLAGSLALAGQDKVKDQPSGKSKPATVKKAEPKVKPGTKWVDVTGSNIKRRVEPGQRPAGDPLNVTVIDPTSAENRGLTAFQMLQRNPTVTLPPGGR